MVLTTRLPWRGLVISGGLQASRLFHPEQQRGHKPLRQPLLVLDVLPGEAFPHALASPHTSWA